MTASTGLPAARMAADGRLRVDWSALLRIAAPLMVTNAIQSILSLTDTWYIGRLSTEAVAAIGAIYWLVTCVVLVLGGVGLAVDIDHCIRPCIKDFLHQWYRLKTIDTKVLHFVVCHLADQTWLTTRAQQIIVMESEQHAIFGGVHIGFDVAIAQIHCSLKRRHGVFWSVTRPAAMGKGDGFGRLHVWMCHDEKLNASSRLRPIFVFQQTLVQLSCWMSWKLLAEINRARALEIGE